MSVVNKMLRDLDARKAGAADSGFLPAAISAMPTDEPSAIWRRIAIAVAFVVPVTAVFFLLQLNRAEDISPSHLPVTPPPQAATPQAAQTIESPLRLETERLQTWPTSPSSVGSAKLRTLPTGKPDAAEPPDESTEAPQIQITSPGATAPNVASKARRTTNGGGLKEPKKIVDLPNGSIEKQVKPTSAEQQAAAEYRLGMAAWRAGNTTDAVTRMQMALVQMPSNRPARQSLASLFIEMRQFEGAEQVLRGGLNLGGDTSAILLMLARVQVERGDTAAALDLLNRHSEPNAKNSEYQGFVAALLFRLGRHQDAVTRYQQAIAQTPTDARWWAGMGMALDGAGKSGEAQSAYRTATSLPGLPPELAAHIAQRLK